MHALEAWGVGLATTTWQHVQWKMGEDDQEGNPLVGLKVASAALVFRTSLRARQ